MITEAEVVGNGYHLNVLTQGDIFVAQCLTVHVRGPIAILQTLEVENFSRRLGIGTNLLGWAEDWAIARGGQLMIARLSTNRPEDQQLTGSFLAKHGYVGRSDDKFHNDDTFARKELTNS